MSTLSLSSAPARSPRARPVEEAVLLPFRAPRAELAHATEFRSTWVVSSLRSLRERGHFEHYRARLTGYTREILECVAGTWLPLEVAHAHYAACDLLGLPISEQVAMGRAVSSRAQGSILATTVKAARGVGVTPWTIAPHFDRLWLRGANGGGAAVYRLGPKEARAEFVGCSLFDVGYFRQAFRGVLLGVGEMFCRAGEVRELPRRASGEATFLLQWV